MADVDKPASSKSSKRNECFLYIDRRRGRNLDYINLERYELPSYDDRNHRGYTFGCELKEGDKPDNVRFYYQYPYDDSSRYYEDDVDDNNDWYMRGDKDDRVAFFSQPGYKRVRVVAYRRRRAIFSRVFELEAHCDNEHHAWSGVCEPEYLYHN